MKTENQESMPMFAIIHNLRCGQSVAGIAARPYLESVEADLRRLESEHAALVAVAEAAMKKLCGNRDLKNVVSTLENSKTMSFFGKNSPAWTEADENSLLVLNSLANLAAVREVNL